MKSPDQGTAAPAWMKWSILLLSVLLTFFFIWLLGFLLTDIGDLKGPDFATIRQSHVNPALAERSAALEKHIQGIDEQVKHQREMQQSLQASMNNARETMQQMMNLQRLSLEQKAPPSAAEREAMATSQRRFLEAQDRFEQVNQTISNSNQSRYDLNQELKSIQNQMEEQQKPARQEYDQRWRQHRFKIASFRLLVIVPLFLLLAWSVYRLRESRHRPILFAVLAATFWKLGTVMFEHFPREFFKYIAISAGILIVLAFLIWMVRKSAQPGRTALLKRFREAYASQRCPLCAYPLARGVLRFAVWTRKGPRLAAPESPRNHGDEPSRYACPSCGTLLYEKCTQCESTRHSLLPYCDGCGGEKRVPELGEEPA